MFPLIDLNSTKQPSERIPQSIDSYSLSSIALSSRQSDAKITNASLTIQLLHTTDFQSRDRAITYSYETIQASIYATSGRQGIASAGLVSTRTVTILARS